MQNVIYNSSSKVSVQSGDSAMIQIASKSMRGDRILHYDPKVRNVAV